MISFLDLRYANTRRDREWDPDNKITPEFRLIELVGELGEMANVAKKLLRERMGLRGTRASKEDLAEELADIQICLDLLAMSEDIDLGAETQAKFNKTSEKYKLETRL